MEIFGSSKELQTFPACSHGSFWSEVDDKFCKEEWIDPQKEKVSKPWEWLETDGACWGFSAYK